MFYSDDCLTIILALWTSSAWSKCRAYFIDETRQYTSGLNFKQIVPPIHNLQEYLPFHPFLPKNLNMFLLCLHLAWGLWWVWKILNNYHSLTVLMRIVQSLMYMHVMKKKGSWMYYVSKYILINNLKETVLTSKIILFQILPSFLVNPYNCVNFKKWFYKIVSITGTYCLASISCVSVFLFSRTTSASSI